MNFEQLEGQWKQYKGQVREKWGDLTDDDMQAIAGKKDKLIGRIQERYGIAKQKAAEQVDEFMRTLGARPEQNIRDPDETFGNERHVHSRGHTAGGS
jgi:uncharacterized protein YjbJ (UPF0337 family)